MWYLVTSLDLWWTRQGTSPFVTKHKVKLDSFEDFAFMLKEGDYLAVDDLDSGYWHVPLHPSQSSLFGVAIYDQVEKKTLFY